MLSTHHVIHEYQALLHNGLLATRQWLLDNALSYHAIDNQLKSGKLIAPHRGIYVNPHTVVTWQSITCSLFVNYPSSWAVGGLTALELQGYGHYVNLSQTSVVHLYGQKNLPKWVESVAKPHRFVWHGTRRLWLDNTEDLLTKHQTDINWRDGMPPLIVSTPERALLELLVNVPEQVSVEHADELVQGMTQLSPRKLTELLNICKHVKVKRLFFWLAERHQYPWCKKLNSGDFDLGAGKRMVVVGGKLDRKYQITMPDYSME
jgi:hypothetical protein